MTKTKIHADICGELTALYARKNHDYGDSFGKSFPEYGMVMACIRLEDKLNRLKTLTRQSAQVKDESIEETLMDLANYAIMTLVEQRIVDPVVEVAENKPFLLCSTCKHRDRLVCENPCIGCWHGDGDDPKINYWEARHEN